MLPQGICHEIEGLIRKLWWGQRGDRRKIHWAKVEWVSRSCLFLMRLYLQNKHGTYCIIKIPCSIEFLKQDFSQVFPSWKQRKAMEVPMLERAF